MVGEIKQNIKKASTWKRGLYMLLFAVFYGLAEVVLFAVIVFQFLLKLFTGDTNARLLELGQNLSTYIYQILQYLSFNTEYQPYPFGSWPQGTPSTEKNKDLDQVLDHIEQDSDVDGD